MLSQAKVGMRIHIQIFIFIGIGQLVHRTAYKHQHSVCNVVLQQFYALLEGRRLLLLLADAKLS
ncbi:hypothetical protein D3C85_1827270 [compost metagenome]